MSTLIQIASNAVVAKLVNADDKVKALVSNALSYMVEGHEFMHAFASGSWDGRSTFFTHRSASFPAGFTHLVHNELVRAGYRVQFIRKPLPAPLGVENPIVDAFGNDDPRYDYQMQVVDRLLRHGMGIAQVATGGGKSKIAKLAIARIRRMTLFLTTRSALMYQMKRSLDDAGYSVGVLGDGEWAPKKGVNVCMVQTLISRLEEPNLEAEVRALVKQAAEKGVKHTRAEFLKMAQIPFDRKMALRNQTIKFLELCEFVIGEEAHEAGGNSYFEILKHCKNAHYRLALTATPFMRDSIEDNMRLMAAFGPIIIQVSEKTLIDRGILATPYFKFITPKPHDKLRKTSPWQRAYTLGIMENNYRNGDIIRECLKAVKFKLPTLILVTRTKHGEFLERALAKFGIRARFIQGETSQTDRQAALDALAAGRLDVVIGTTILDVGVDVPALGMVILAGGGKAEVSLRQRIGRGLRAKKNGPNVCFIVDFSDGVNNTLREHAQQRRAIVEATPGFAENILKLGQDFPWGLFSLSAAA